MYKKYKEIREAYFLPWWDCQSEPVWYLVIRMGTYDEFGNRQEGDLISHFMGPRV